MKKELTLHEIQQILGYEVKIVADKPMKVLSEVPVGETFKLGDMEFIVLEHLDGTTNVLLKNFWKKCRFDNNVNNFSISEIRERLNDEFYKKVAAICGENIIPHVVDLTSDDGRKDYGKGTVRVSLLTCDLYRKYVYILDKYRPDDWWWLATPYSTKENGYDSCVRVVNRIGALYGNRCYCNDGVRPFLTLKSSIFVS